MQEEIFVFGSNLAGRHGAGAAKTAVLYHGAVYGVGEGCRGNSYAIPTKDRQLNVICLKDIAISVQTFIDFAKANKDLDFMLTAIGCGLAGYDAKQIAPLFAQTLELQNVYLPLDFCLLFGTTTKVSFDLKNKRIAI